MSLLATTPALWPPGYDIQRVTLALSTIAINILALAVPITTLQVYDRILRNQSVDTLQVLVIGVCVAVVLDVSLRLTRSYLLGFNGAAYVHRMSASAMDHVVNTELRSMAGENVAIGLSRIAAVRNLRDFFNGHAFTVFLDLCFVPIYLLVIWYMAGAVVLIPMAVVAGFALMSGHMGVLLKRHLEARRLLDDRRYDFLMRTLDGVHSVKAFAAEYLQLRNYEAFHDRSCRANHRLSTIGTRSFNNATLASAIMTAFVVSYGAYAATHGQMTVGAMIAVVLVSSRIMQPIQRGLVLWVQFQDFTIARDRVERIFSKPLVEILPAERQPANTGYLEIKDLKFGYRDDLPPLLDGINLRLRRGEAICISGGTGSGKSTLLKILAGIYRPTQGEVRIDGVNLASVEPDQILRNVGYLSASGSIFRGTIRDNITRFGAIPFAEAVEVISALGMKQEFSALPHGFDTRLTGMLSDPISPGVKHIITLLRALVSKPRIILFDNADMCLDQVSYQRLYRILASIKPQSALVIVANDQNFRSLADHHYTLVGGTLVSQSRAGNAQLSIIDGGAT
jgi:ATP-binding cassette, subfamily C, bacterial LapB